MVLRLIKYAEVIAILITLSCFASTLAEPVEQGGNDSSAPGGYILSAYDGRIAVFEDRSSKPIEVFDVYISSLPYSEQNELINGIRASDKSELQRLIEDYTS